MWYIKRSDYVVMYEIRCQEIPCTSPGLASDWRVALHFWLSMKENSLNIATDVQVICLQRSENIEHYDLKDAVNATTWPRHYLFLIWEHKRKISLGSWHFFFLGYKSKHSYEEGDKKANGLTLFHWTILFIFFPFLEQSW